MLKELRLVDFVKKAYEWYNIQGWGAFVVKEKLKHLKKDIKKWIVEKFGSQQALIESLVSNINNMNSKEELGGISLEEASERETMLKYFWKMFKDLWIYSLPKVESEVDKGKGWKHKVLPYHHQLEEKEEKHQEVVSGGNWCEGPLLVKK